MLFLQIATFLEGACKDDLERIVSLFEVLFDRHPAGDELVFGSRSVVRTLSITGAYRRTRTPGFWHHSAVYVSQGELSSRRRDALELL